jgi:hypothetical protein
MTEEPKEDVTPSGFWARMGWFLFVMLLMAAFVWGFAYLFGQLWEYLQWGQRR